MKIEIWVGDKKNIDINSPIEMTLEEKNKVDELMKSLFNPIEFEETNQFRDWRMSQEGRIQYPHLWSPKEYEVLLNCNSIEEGVSKLGRSGMSVIIRSGDWVSKYYSWCEKNKKEVKEWNNLENIRQFLKEHKDEIFKRRKIKTSANKIEKINKRLEEVDKKIIDLRKREQEFGYTSIAVESRRDRKDLEEEKEELEKELGEIEELKEKFKVEKSK